MTKQRFNIVWPVVFFIYLSSKGHIDAAKFSTKGPIFTVTLKDPYAPTGDSTESTTTDEVDESGDQQDEEGLPYTKRHRFLRPFGRRKNRPSMIEQLTGLSSLSPSCLWSVETVDAPFPDLLPSLRKAVLTAGYRYEDLKTLPCFIEGDIRLALLSGNNDNNLNTHPDGLLKVQIKPIFHVAQNMVKCGMRIMGQGDGNSRYAMAKFHLTGGSAKNKFLEFFRASYDVDLPFASVGSMSVTPSHDFLKGETSCTIVGKSGSSRTAAVLDLNWDHPTLSIVHALDERNTISPEISLHNAQITYNWNVRLGDSGSIKTTVDPTSAIQLTWTDRSMNGKWVTDFRLPLTNAVVNDGRPLSADIRVRRQFMF